MLKSRRLKTETLEKRRLLAASIEPLGIPSFREIPAEMSVRIETVQNAESAESFHDHVLSPQSLPIHWQSPGNSDLTQEVDGRLYTIDQDPASQRPATLYIFDRLEDGSLNKIGEFDLEIAVETMLVSGDQVVLLGSTGGVLPYAIPHDQTLRQPTDSDRPFMDTATSPIWRGFRTSAVTISMGDTVSLSRQPLDGFDHVVSQDGDTIVLATSNPFGPVPLSLTPSHAQSTLTEYKITADGLVDSRAGQIASGEITPISDSEFLASSSNHEWPSDGQRRHSGPFFPVANAMLTRVDLESSSADDSTTDETDSLRIGAGYVRNLLVSEDGNTAVTIRDTWGSDGHQSFIDVIDLSGDRLQLLRSISLSDATGETIDGAIPIQLANNRLLIRSESGRQLIVVNLGELDSDSTNADRFEFVEMPDGFSVGHESLAVSADTVLLTATQKSADEIGSRSLENLTTDSFLTVSISGADVVAQSAASNDISPVSVNRLQMIDASSQRLGFHRITLQDGSRQESFVFGQLDADGVFNQEGVIPIDHWIEIDTNGDRLIVRQSDRLLEYAWDNIDAPTITALGDPLPAIEAIDDEFTVVENGDTQWLDVVANDVNTRSNAYPSEITELIGAPEGAEIIGRDLIRIPPTAALGRESFEFQYVISNGRTQSTATVNVTVVAPEVDPRVEAVIQQAAADLSVPVDSIEVTSVAYFISDTIGHPGHTVSVIVNDDGQTITVQTDSTDTTSEGSTNGLHVELSFPGGTAAYESEQTTGIRQLWIKRDEATENFVDLGLRAVDTNGDELTSITQGDEFWIEFTAQDLRDAGGGVYGAFFDLELSNSTIELTGEVESDPAFQQIGTSTIAVDRVDELGAISSGTDAPGNAIQSVLRLKARAIAAGAVMLALNPADTTGTETLLHGINNEIPNANVRYGALNLTVAPVADQVVVQLGLNATDDDGEPLQSVIEGDEFWIDFSAKDLRAFGAGVFAAFTDIEVSGDAIELTGQYEFDSAFQKIGEPVITANSVNEIGGVAISTLASGNDPQRILRLRAKAVGSGQANVSLNPTETIGAETLLLGIDSVVPDAAVAFGELAINVEAASAESVFDTDGNGEVTALDALRVINVLIREGVAVQLNEITVSAEGESVMSPEDYATLSRHDVNRDGNITVLDALMVVNQLSKQQNLDSANGEQIVTQGIIAADDGRDDEDEGDVEASPLDRTLESNLG